jgi:GxxExxY protein
LNDCAQSTDYFSHREPRGHEEKQETDRKIVSAEENKDWLTDGGSTMGALPPLSPDLEDLARSVIDAGFQVHRAMGPGLLESVYEACLRIEFDKRGIAFESQAGIPIVYSGVRLESGLRLDLLVEKSLIVEVKSTDKLVPIHQSQLLTYLRLSGLRLGLLMNFNVLKFSQGVKRVIL